MGIYLPNMEMPKNCGECPFIFTSWGIEYYCHLAESSTSAEYVGREKMANCPLVEIPTPHGRLGDLDALKAQYKYGEADSEDEKVWMMNIRRAIANAPTVIEAEGSEA